ncbi:MAG: hypothetical protein KatS3mg105_3483 [Gemmatales bacterium]|nr:MAG: hypothetical protein KatS3mg105_3483 [Gemmatales bacterium]
MQLRPYQHEAIAAVYEHLRQRDDNPCVVIPTAGGKTPVMASICKDAVGLWQGRVLILAHVKELLEQAADKLKKVCPDVRFGIYSAGLKRRDTEHAVIIAGIQSVYKRACELDAFDLVIIDEAHMIAPEGDGMYRRFLADAKAVNPNVRIIGFTATPFRLKSGPICTPDGFLNHICYEVGVRELIVQGYLCPLVTKAGASRADFDRLHVRAGEFVADEVEDLMDDDQLVEAACREVVQYTQDRQAVLVFASGIKHGRHIVRVLREKHGIECGFVTGGTPIKEREMILGRFRRGELKYLCNVNVLTTGFDAPYIDCVVLLRPTMSPGLYYQMCLDMETEVLTPYGWRQCHEVSKGDIVAAFDLQTEEIVSTPALDKVHRVLRSHESMLGIVAPHLDIRITNEHNLVVRGRAKTCLHWHLQTAQSAATRRETFLIPVAGRGDCHNTDAPLTDDEVAFIGWFLTDGCLNRSNQTITISQSKHVDEVRALLLRCGFGFCAYEVVRVGKHQGHAHGVNFVISRGSPRRERAGLRGWAALAEWLDKDIPAVFDTLSTRQFGILLHAMNQANGANRRARGYRSRVMSISVGCRQRMANRIQQLAIERGFRCNVATTEPSPSNWNATPQRQWLIRVKPQRTASIGGTRSDSSPIGATRCQIQPVPFLPNEWVWCLTTEQGTLVTRRNGKVAIVGNCGRGFRLHPGKQNCLVLDFGGNVLRHGPVDAITAPGKQRQGDGPVPAKRCPECNSVIAAGYARCPDCGYEFPPPERQKHEAKASDAGILSGQATTTRYQVHDVCYSVHSKRGAGADAPKTMRVDYRVGWHDYKSEWVCFEHSGYARHKAVQWWKERSQVPVPETAEEAVDLAEVGHLAPTRAITVRSVAGERFDRIIGYELGEMPPVPDESCWTEEDVDFPFGANAVSAEEVPW